MNDLPRFAHDDAYSGTLTPIRTVADLRRLIADAPDDMRVYLFGCPVDTAYDVAGSIRTQQCKEHSGLVHDRTGLILMVDG